MTIRITPPTAPIFFPRSGLVFFPIEIPSIAAMRVMNPIEKTANIRLASINDKLNPTINASILVATESPMIVGRLRGLKGFGGFFPLKLETIILTPKKLNNRKAIQ